MMVRMSKFDIAHNTDIYATLKAMKTLNFLIVLTWLVLVGAVVCLMWDNRVRIERLEERMNNKLERRLP